MNNDALNNELVNLERKLNLLLTDYKRLKKDYDTVQNENNELKEKLKSKNQKINDFQNKLNINQLVNDYSKSNNVDNEKIKNILDTYIKEIDNCISAMNEL